MDQPEPELPRLRGEYLLPMSVHAPALARRWIAELLADDDFADLTPTAQLLASEVVTNAVLHAESVCTMRVEQSNGCVRVTVTDSGEHADVEMADPTQLPTGGLGLRIVNALAQRWGVDQVSAGNAVWFELEARSNHSISL